MKTSDVLSQVPTGGSLLIVPWALKLSIQLFSIHQFPHRFWKNRGNLRIVFIFLQKGKVNVCPCNNFRNSIFPLSKSRTAPIFERNGVPKIMLEESSFKTVNPVSPPFPSSNVDFKENFLPCHSDLAALIWSSHSWYNVFNGLFRHHINSSTRIMYAFLINSKRGVWLTNCYLFDSVSEILLSSRSSCQI